MRQQLARCASFTRLLCLNGYKPGRLVTHYTGMMGDTPNSGRTLDEVRHALLETAPMQQREQFISDHARRLFTMRELCDRYNISRKTGYKWLTRFNEHGRGGLSDRSHAPRRCPHKISHEMAVLLCRTRRAHPSWGPEKILDHLKPKHREIRQWPAFSTISDLFVRRGLIKKRRRRRKVLHPGSIPIRTSAPNDLWTADFKGQFRTADGIYCYPLTIRRSAHPLSARVPRPAFRSHCGGVQSV